ncbi:MAG TPA: RodZ domain-containing protein [Acidimicrobiales bacterium]|nr:RodZ domain-containing protein [Acidimicrobiales bacterium]
MWIGGILAAVVVVGVIAAAVFRHRSRDDAHSVEHYHRQLHTLEEMRTHLPPGTEASADNGQDEEAYPASAFKVSGTSTVRLTDPGHSIVPPAPPPPVKNPSEPVLFVDSHLTHDTPGETPKTTFMTGVDDKAMHFINNRPKRIGALAAFAAVVVLIVVLIVAGMHSNTPAPKHPTSGTATTVATTPSHSHPPSGSAGAAGQQGHKKKANTTTTVAPVVSAPAPTSPNAANYAVGVADYSLSLSAASGDCWVSATNTSNGSVLFTGVLTAGQSHTIAATGPVTVVAGAPAAFAATVNGVAVQLPFGFQAPFTLKFDTPGTGGGSSSSTTTTT